MLALFVPTLAQTGAGIEALLGVSSVWALFCAYLVAFGIPIKAFRFSLAILCLALPVTAAWVGYTSLNGLGPAVEAIGSVLRTNKQEVVGGILEVVKRPSFVLPYTLHIIFLAAAMVGSRGRVAPVAKPVLFGCLVLIFLLQLAQNSSTISSRIWRSSDISASLVLSYADWIVAAAENDLWRDDWHKKIKQRPTPAAMKKPAGPQLAVFVIGESTRFSALGPDKAARGPWSRRLQDRIERGLGAWTPPVCSTTDFTMYSVLMMLTGTPANHLSDAFSSPTLINRLHAAGYRTALIRNQADDFGDADFLWDAPYSTRTTYDLELLDPVERFLVPLFNNADLEPRAVVLHTAGAHVPYNDHYPSSMFPPERDDLSQDARDELEYDRANEVVAQLLERLGEILDQAPQPAVLVYLSDHGENMPSDRNGLRLHMAARISMAGDLVPGLILWNRFYAESHHPTVLLAKLLSARRIAQHDVYNAFLNLSDLSDEPILPTSDPLVRGSFEKGEKVKVGSCYALKP
jgi:glucan phosphoethanolaminetransferase (alkaline phosphatase superfamily)